MKFSGEYKGAGDYEMWSRFRKLKHKIIDKVLINYRKHLSNATTNKDLFREEHARIVQYNLLYLDLDL